MTDDRKRLLRRGLYLLLGAVALYEIGRALGHPGDRVADSLEMMGVFTWPALLLSATALAHLWRERRADEVTG